MHWFPKYSKTMDTFRKDVKSKMEEGAKMNKEDHIKLIQEKAGLDDNSMKYLQFYRYGDELLEKLANAMK